MSGRPEQSLEDLDQIGGLGQLPELGEQVLEQLTGVVEERTSRLVPGKAQAGQRRRLRVEPSPAAAVVRPPGRAIDGRTAPAERFTAAACLPVRTWLSACHK